ncbi:MAG: TldD/PmbA family protein [Anaeroplasmataceae bacterium]
MKLNNNELKNILLECLSTGADFAELYFEDKESNSIVAISNNIDEVVTSQTYGVGIRILKDLEEVYGYTNSQEYNSIMKLASSLKKSYDSQVVIKDIKFKELKHDKHTIINNLSKNITNSNKTKYLTELNKEVLSHGSVISQAIARLTDSTQFITIVNSEGLIATDTRNIQRIACTAVVSKDGKMESHTQTYGGNFSTDYFDDFDMKNMANTVASKAISKLDAIDMVGGVYDVVINDAFGGVIFHEACGHSLEATSVAKNLSVFSNKLGQKIASELVTAIDDGTIPNEWGSNNIDDEGSVTQKNVLIKDGILTNYLIDKRNARRMNTSANGASRRESYKYSPTSRMSNTYIANGKSTKEEIIKATKYGIFAVEMGGGSVNPTTGEYNFSVSEGYLIENGVLTKPVKGATLIGNGKDTLLNVDMVGNNQSFGYGMCGSMSGSIPACVGQPTIRVKNMTVGGTGVKND